MKKEGRKEKGEIKKREKNKGEKYPNNKLKYKNINELGIYVNQKKISTRYCCQN